MARRIIFLFSCFLFGACDIIDDCIGSNKERSGLTQLSERQTQWQGNQINDYLLVYSVLCFCAVEQKEVTVTNGEISRVVIKNESGEFLREIPENEFADYYTVNSFYELIMEIDKTADKFSVEYDSSLGYPTTIDVDPYAQRCDCSGSCSEAVDDEYSYQISVILVN